MLLNRIKTTFRVIAFLEGVSFILLMTVGLYCKYQLDDQSYVKLLGMPHGLLFISYLILAFLIKNGEQWKNKDFVIPSINFISKKCGSPPQIGFKYMDGNRVIHMSCPFRQEFFVV